MVQSVCSILLLSEAALYGMVDSKVYLLTVDQVSTGLRKMEIYIKVLVVFINRAKLVFEGSGDVSVVSENKELVRDIGHKKDGLVGLRRYKSDEENLVIYLGILLKLLVVVDTLIGLPDLLIHTVDFVDGENKVFLVSVFQHKNLIQRKKPLVSTRSKLPVKSNSARARKQKDKVWYLVYFISTRVRKSRFTDMLVRWSHVGKELRVNRLIKEANLFTG